MRNPTSFSQIRALLVVLPLILTSCLLPSHKLFAKKVILPQEIPQIGDIRLFGGNFVPFPGTWLECNGQQLSKNIYSELFSLVGTTYGGDGNPNFALPNLKAPVKGLRYLICVSGQYPKNPNVPPPPPPPPGLPFIGSIRTFSGSFVPWPGTWMECNGQMLNKEKYPTIFEIIGTKFGGDGNPSFALPKLKAQTQGERYLICVAGNFPSKPN